MRAVGAALLVVLLGAARQSNFATVRLWSLMGSQRRYTKSRRRSKELLSAKVRRGRCGADGAARSPASGTANVTSPSTAARNAAGRRYAKELHRATLLGFRVLASDVEQIDAGTLTKEERRLQTQFTTLVEEIASVEANQILRDPAADKFDSVAELLATMDFQAIWREVTLPERRKSIEALIHSAPVRTS